MSVQIGTEHAEYGRECQYDGEMGNGSQFDYDRNAQSQQKDGLLPEHWRGIRKLNRKMLTFRQRLPYDLIQNCSGIHSYF